MKCRRCEQEKQEHDFYWKNEAKGIRQTVCSDCVRERNAHYRQTRGEQYNENRKLKYRENLERVRQGRREEYARNRKKFLAQNKRWREANPEAYSSSASLSYRKHRNERLEAQDEYRNKNREKLNAYVRKHYAKKRLDPAWREKERIRSLEKNRKEKQLVLEAYGKQCACCGETEPLFLTIDHIQGNGNQERRELGIPGGNTFYRFLRKSGYPPGYQVLCFNCNAGTHINGGVCPHKLKGD